MLVFYVAREILEVFVLILIVTIHRRLCSSFPTSSLSHCLDPPPPRRDLRAGAVKAHTLRSFGKAELTAQLSELRTELHSVSDGIFSYVLNRLFVFAAITRALYLPKKKKGELRFYGCHLKGTIPVYSSGSIKPGLDASENINVIQQFYFLPRLGPVLVPSFHLNLQQGSVLHFSAG